MSDRKLFQQQVKSILTPELKQDGFRQSGMTFRRVTGHVVHIFTIQASSYGGQCCVCLGVHLDFLPTVGTNQPCEPLKISEPECEFRSRLAPEGVSDHWWPYGDSEQDAISAVSSILELYRLRAAPYFERFSSFPEDFTHVTPETPEESYRALLPRYSTEVRRDLALSRIYSRLGDALAVRHFASRGLASAGPAVALKAAFRDLLSHV